jgi:hypothetical protein
MICAISKYPEPNGIYPSERNSIFNMRYSLTFAALLATQFLFTAISPANAGPVVAIHDSELTRALESMTATNAGTPTGPGFTGFEWWPTNWHYFVMPESLKEALASDGTAFEVISDADITAGRLFTNGQPRYPIVISLASEAVADSEIGPLTNYVAAGGTLLVGSSSFTRRTNGAGRGDFAIASQMGLHTVTTNLQNWAANTVFLKTVADPLIAHIPAGSINWHMPSAADETLWGISPSHTLPQTSLAWQVQAADATVIAQGDIRPYLAVKQYGKGTFIYHAGMQPLIAHGGYGPGMYAYGIFRNAIQAAFAAARAPLPRVSPWPYPYDAALNVRHDFEDFTNMINAIESSARFEFTNGVKGDYYFCTGTLRVEMTNSPVTIARLRSAITNYGATIGPHNGGLRNPNNTNLVVADYDYWHWGPDEALNVTPAGYPSGKAYASASLSNAFLDVEGWLSGITNGVRAWVSPYFNATRENSYDLQQQLGVKIAGEQKLTPFPHWTLSTATSAKKYPFLTLPVSDWFTSADIGQSMEIGHTSASVHALVDYYYSLGALINLYSHSGSDGTGTSGPLVQDYITYSMTKPRLWAANAVGVYSWWNARKTAQIVPTFTTTSNQTTVTLAISGATNSQTAVEVLIPQPSYSGLQVFTNGVLASGTNYRTSGQLVKISVGNSVTNAQIKYLLSPMAQDDQFATISGVTLNVPASGVLANDTVGLGTNLTATLVSGTTNGSLSLSANGGFTYTPATNFNGYDAFTYSVNDGLADGNVATVTIHVVPTASVLFSDDFTRTNDPGALAPWLVHAGNWTVTGGVLKGGTNSFQNYGFAYLTNTWTNYTIEGRLQFPAGAFGGGLGGRLNPLTGAHYAAWIYPENSPGGDRQLKLIKFQNWSSFGYNGVSSVPIQQVTLPSVGTNWHTLKVAFQGNQISVFFDGNQMISVTDAEAQPLTSGGVSVDMWTDTSAYVMNVDDITIAAPIGDQTITFATLPNRTYGDAPFGLAASAPSGLPVSFNIVSGPAVLSGTNVTMTAAGAVVIRASQAGDASYQNAPAVDRSFIVNPATLTVQADDKSKVYGAALPALTVSYSGFVNGETTNVLSGSPTIGSTATPGSAVGTYSITPVMGTLGAPNYVFSFVDGQLTVTKAALTVTASNASRNFGDPDPAFSASYTGFVNGDTSSALSGAPAFTTTAVSTSVEGNYPINVGIGTLSSANYNFSFASGILTIYRQHVLFSDDFSRTNDPGTLTPWVIQSNDWTITSGTLKGGVNPTFNYGFIYLTNVWTNFSVQARIQFPVGAFGGGVGGRLSSASGTHYAAWVYPEGSPGGSSVLKLIKFSDWGHFGYTNSSFISIQEAALPGVGTNWHTVKLTFSTNQISVYYDSNSMITATDVEAQPLTNGGISLDMWTDSNPYVMNVDDVLVTEPPINQTISFATLANKTYGDAPFGLSATASSGLPVNFSILSGPATLSGNSVTITGAGSVTIRASQPGSTAFNAAPIVDRSFTVNPAALTVTADNKSRAYGAANPAFTGSVTGIQNGDNITATYSTLADPTSSVGSYSIVPSLNDPDGKLGNYNVATGIGTLTVTPATLTVTIDNKSRAYGASNPALTGGLAGIQNSDNITANYTTVATTGSPVGSYAILPVFSDPGSKLPNYNVITNGGSLTITPATLTVTADNKSRTYGAADPLFTVSFNGFVNGENPSVVSGSPALSTTAMATSGVGSYTITPSQGSLSAANYNFAFVNGTLSITAATLTGTADNKSRHYGDTNPVFTVTYTGFVNGETAVLVTGTLTSSTTAETNSPVGNYPITVSGQSAPNYAITYVAATLSVTPAPLLVKADDKSRAYSTTNPVFSATITGLVNGEANNVLEGTLAFTTPADTNSPIGIYPIEVSGLTSTNYSITFSNGSLTVTPFALSVTADNKSRTYGSPNPAFTGTLTGVQNGDGIAASYSTIADATSPIGTYTIIPTLNDPNNKLTNYSVTINDGTLTVSAAALTVTADNHSRAYGSANPTLTGTLNGVHNGDDITASYSTFADTASPIGAYNIVPALNDPNSKLTNYIVTVTDGTLTVTAAALTVAADDQSRVYGSANPTLSGMLKGVQNGDNITASYSTVADTTSPVGPYNIVPALNDPGSKLTNYSVTISNGTLTVTAAPLTVAADNQTRTYGATNPPLTGTLVGIQNSDNITGSYSTLATVLSPVGPYAITPSLTDPDGKLLNYTVTANDGTLNVTPATLIGTADNKSRLYGETNPEFTVTYTGFVNTQKASIVTGTLISSTTAETNSPVGNYPITLSGQTAPNYTITYVDGTLSVTPAPLLVTADNNSRAYGQTNPIFTATIAGFVNAEDTNVLTGDLIFTTAAETNSPIGNYSIEPSGLSATNYSLTFSNGTLTVSAFALTVTADNQSRPYGSANPTLTGTLAGVQNGDNITANYTTTADTNSSVGIYDILPHLVDPDGKLTNYAISTNIGALHITSASLTVTADNHSRTYGAANPALTGTLSGVQNGDDITANYSTVADLISPIGTYSIVPSLNDPNSKLTNYNVTTNNGTLTIASASLTVTADNQTRIYGSTNPTLTGTLTGVQNGDGITASYSTVAALASPVGTYSIVPALNDPNNKLTNYNVAINDGIFTVTAAPLTVAANNQTRTYGATNPVFTGTLTGVLNSDNITASYSTIATALSPVASYEITPSLYDPDGKLVNYAVSVTNGTLQITPATLTGTADNKSRLYGETNPVFTVTYTGFVNGETSALVTGTLLSSTTAETNSPVGNYPITVLGQSAPNYTIHYVDGMLSVTTAPLLVKADDKSRAYGHTNRVFTATISGLVNGEGSNVLEGKLGFTTVADTNTPIGTYPIEVSGLTSTNYSIIFSNGTLTVTPFALTVTADNKFRTYGSTNPAFTGTLTGVQNGDDITANYSTVAEATSPIGVYSIAPALNDPNNKLTNYSVTINDGTLTVTAAALSVTADNHSRVYGSANPTLTGTLTGVQNGDDITASYSTLADATSPIGTYNIVPALNDPTSKLTNYSVTINQGTLTVTVAALSVTADNHTRVYGSANPTLTGTLSGVQNGDDISATYSTLADTASPIGTYSIIPALNDPNNKLTNYSVTINDGTLTVTAATLTVTADNHSRVYGSANPTLTGTLIGVQNGDNITATYSTTAGLNSSVGTHSIIPALNDPNGKLTNYSITISNGTLTITTANSSLALLSSVNPSTEASTVNFTATVSPVAPATPIPTGNVQFFANGAALGAPAGLVNGVANVNTSNLSAGSNTIAAVYLGDGNFLSSTNTLIQVVNVNLAQPITLGIVANGNGTVTVTFQGTPGGQYIVQSTASLSQPITWSNVSTNTAGVDGSWIYTDSTTQPQAFYRAGKTESH